MIQQNEINRLPLTQIPKSYGVNLWNSQIWPDGEQICMWAKNFII